MGVMTILPSRWLVIYFYQTGYWVPPMSSLRAIQGSKVLGNKEQSRTLKKVLLALGVYKGRRSRASSQFFFSTSKVHNSVF